jgi:hypothetical protein
VVEIHNDLHKDTISNGRCVVPLRKEWGKFDSLISLSSTQMSSQQVVMCPSLSDANI